MFVFIIIILLKIITQELFCTSVCFVNSPNIITPHSFFPRPHMCLWWNRWYRCCNIAPLLFCIHNFCIFRYHPHPPYPKAPRYTPGTLPLSPPKTTPCYPKPQLWRNHNMELFIQAYSNVSYPWDVSPEFCESQPIHKSYISLLSNWYLFSSEVILLRTNFILLLRTRNTLYINLVFIIWANNTPNKFKTCEAILLYCARFMDPYFIHKLIKS